MTKLDPTKGDSAVLPSYCRPVMRQVGWLGHSGEVYPFDDSPSAVTREPAGFQPLYIQIGTWEDLGDGRWGIKD